MGDYFLKKSYDNIKDSAWPNITGYHDFSNLPQWIIDECNEQHGFDRRTKELHDTDYLFGCSGQNLGYRYRNFLYVPVKKCASTHYQMVFGDLLGWQKIKLNQVDWDNIDAFGFLINPLTRKVKGIVEVLCQCYRNSGIPLTQLLSDLDGNPGLYLFFSKIAAVDAHSLPYWLTFDRYFDLINWAPIDFLGSDATDNWIKNFFSARGISIDLPSDLALQNKTGDIKKEIFSRVQQSIFENEPPIEHYQLLAPDIQVYKNLVDSYKKKNP